MTSETFSSNEPQEDVAPVSEPIWVSYVTDEGHKFSHAQTDLNCYVKVSYVGYFYFTEVCAAVEFSLARSASGMENVLGRVYLDSAGLEF